MTHDHPYEAIVATAKEKGCDLIVMASHGAGRDCGGGARQRHDKGPDAHENSSSMRRFHDNSSAIMNKRNATPNSAMGAICPTSVIETAESQDTSLARAPRPNGPRTMPRSRPATGLQ